MTTVTLRPSANGVLIELTPSPGTLQNYQCVDEETPNDDTDYVLLAGSSVEAQTKYDYYDIPTTGIPAGSTINSVTVYTRGRKVQLGTIIARICGCVHTYNVAYEGTFKSLTTSWANYSDTWTTNPNTGLPWTLDEVNAMQIGVGLYTAKNENVEADCTQVYVVVDYTPPVVVGRVVGDGLSWVVMFLKPFQFQGLLRRLASIVPTRCRRYFLGLLERLQAWFSPHLFFLGNKDGKVESSFSNHFFTSILLLEESS